jgi:exopolysaccharide biosynthesis predicted pyruvyltransferase EpsI/GR25 family glycosyltransferase involved in LPS biosynthesis
MNFIISIVLILFFSILFGLIIYKKDKFEIFDIKNFLEKYKNKKIIYIPNPGNAGDSLIAYGTIQTFDKLGLNYDIGNIDEKYNNEILFFAGGGNLVGLYSDCKKFILNNKDSNEIVILPHTIKDEDKLLKSLGDNIKIICREKKSFDYVSSLIKNKENVFLSKDMAFYIDGLDEYKNIKGKGVCNAYRKDVEKTNIYIPKDNIDLSSELEKPNNTQDKNVIKEVSLSIFKYISEYDIINTNRLHIAIASSLLDKNVNFYKNSYYKNEEIYKYSIKNNFPKTKLNLYDITNKIPVFYINLDDNKDRNEDIIKLIKKFDFKNSKRIPAVNTKTFENVLKYEVLILEDSLNKLKINNNKQSRTKHLELTNGSIGCYISHLNVYKKMLENNVEFALVFEDDLTIDCIKEEFWNVIKDINIPPDTDIFLLDAIYSKNNKNEIISKIKFFLCLHCYIITLNGAKKILEIAYPIEMQIDSFFSKLAENEKLNIYVLKENKSLKIKQNHGKFETNIQNLPSIREEFLQYLSTRKIKL